MEIIGLNTIKVEPLKDTLDLYMDKINRLIDSEKQQKQEYISTIFPPVHVNCKMTITERLNLIDAIIKS